MTLVSDNLASPAAAAPANSAGGLPQEVEFILSALEAAQFTGKTRRTVARRAYRAEASIKLFSDTPQAPPWTIYVRDISPKGLGFVTRHRLPLGYGGILTIVGPHGKTVKIDCTLLRCREAVQGWFEGSMYFNREQTIFDAEFLKRR
jgi:PilZ domain